MYIHICIYIYIYMHTYVLCIYYLCTITNVYTNVRLIACIFSIIYSTTIPKRSHAAIQFPPHSEERKSEIPATLNCGLSEALPWL